MVARASDDKLDSVSAPPSSPPNDIHVNTRVLIPSSAESRWGAHAMMDSYLPALEAQAR